MPVPKKEETKFVPPPGFFKGVVPGQWCRKATPSGRARTCCDKFMNFIQLYNMRPCGEHLAYESSRWECSCCGSVQYQAEGDWL